MKVEDYFNEKIDDEKILFLKGETTELNTYMIGIYNKTREVYERIFSDIGMLEDLATQTYISIGVSEIYPVPSKTQDNMVSLFAFIAKEELGIDFYINDYQLETHIPYQCSNAVYERYERLARDKEDEVNEIFMKAVDRTLEKITTRDNKPSHVAVPQFWIDDNKEFLDRLERLTIAYKPLGGNIVLLTISSKQSGEVVPEMLLKYLKEKH